MIEAWLRAAAGPLLLGEYFNFSFLVGKDLSTVHTYRAIRKILRHSYVKVLSLTNLDLSFRWTFPRHEPGTHRLTHQAWNVVDSQTVH